MATALLPAHDDPVAALAAAIPSDPAGASRAGLKAMQIGEEDRALPLLRQAVQRHACDARLWQVFGLTARALDDLPTAADALAQARRLAPADALIAHGHARARLEAGYDAVDAFEAARRLAPADGSVLQGLAAARLASGHLEGAVRDLASSLVAQPLWLDGHATLARLRRLAGHPEPLASYREALARTPTAGPLWGALLGTLQLAERFADMPATLAAARAAIGEQPGFALLAAIAADETGDPHAAARYFDRHPAADAGAAVWHARALLRRGRCDDAARVAERWAKAPGGRTLWPYVAIAWRAMGDPRWIWLEGDPAFVQVYDLGTELPDLDALATLLRRLHVARERPLDQSVRGGTQTDGPLLSRAEPEIAALRDAIRRAVTRYADALPAPDATHPLLAPARRPIRFAGSWSVRLAGGGHHADHVHPQGWISSALYVALPDGIAGGSGEGCLTLGTSTALLPDLKPFRTIEPRPGRLVLFPSTMWHGTRPFGSGERLTVAFDVARFDR